MQETRRRRWGRLARTALLLAGVASSSGCSDGSDDVALDDGLPATCHPLRSPGVCAAMYPASHYLADDSQTATGFRLALGPEHFPTSELGVSFDTTHLATRDGFSPSSPITAVFAERASADALPPIDAPEESLQDTSATLVFDAATGERVMHFAELDAQVKAAEHHQAILVRPLARLAFNTRYVVVFRRHLRTASGSPMPAPIGYRGVPAHLEEPLSRAGVDASEVLVTWDFVTSSLENTTRDLSAMVSQTLTILPEDGLGYTITGVDEEFSNTTVRRVRGTFTVPRFLSHGDFTDPAVELNRDADGVPTAPGTFEAPFVMLVPRSATEAEPAQLTIYGHGFVNTAEGAFGSADDERFPQRFGNSHRFAFIGTDWLGLSDHETKNGAIPMAVEDLNNLPLLSRRLKQAVVNNLVLARTAQAIAADPLVTGGAPEIIVADELHYLGISLGGIMGSVLMGYTPDIERAIFHVGAASWSTLLQRSKLWSLFRIFLDPAYDTPLEQLHVIRALQLEFDEVEGLSRASELTDGHNVLLQVGLHDDVVSNVASTTLARTMALPTLNDLPTDVVGLETSAGPLPSAFTVFDTGQVPPPTSNTANAAVDPNDAHEMLREVGAVQTQMNHFLRTGEVVSACDGACDPE